MAQNNTPVKALVMAAGGAGASIQLRLWGGQIALGSRR